MEYTPEQHKAVLRVMRLKVTDYYGHLLVEKTCTSIEIKKAYRKQALIMHPDKNKAPQSDEAFKRVSKAFQVLSDDTKRRIYDQTGADPDARAQPGQQYASSFNQPNFPFQQRQHPFGNQFGPEDLFSQFFGAPPGAQQFHFQFGGGDDIFSQLFGQPNRQRQRQRQQYAEEKDTGYGNLINLAIIVMILVLPTLFGMLFDSSSSSNLPKYTFHKTRHFSSNYKTPKYNIDFFVSPKDMKKMDPNKFEKLRKVAENTYVRTTKQQCKQEYLQQQQDMQDAVGWLFTDEDAYNEAKERELPSCDLLERLGIRK